MSEQEMWIKAGEILKALGVRIPSATPTPDVVGISPAARDRQVDCLAPDWCGKHRIEKFDHERGYLVQDYCAACRKSGNVDK